MRLRLPSLLLALFTVGSLHSQPVAPSPAEVQSLRAASAHHLRAAAEDTPWTVDPASREESRQFYRTFYGLSEGVPSGWTGSIATGNAGTTTDAFKDAVRQRVNFYRAYAGVPAAVTMNATFSAKAQEAALMMSANNAISHSPPTSWTYYTANGAEAAAKSNLGIGTRGPDTIDGYMVDHGANNAIVGHRRWLLYPQTVEMGTGDVDSEGSFAPANVLWVQDARIFDARPTARDEFVAWPTKGYVPYQLVWARWSISLKGADFDNATVSMTRNGAPIAATIEARSNSSSAPESTLVWLYDNKTGDDRTSHDRPTADVTYAVTVGNVVVGGVTRSFSYNVIVFDPDVPSADFAAPTVSGTAAPSTAGAHPYQVTLPGFATGFAWRELTLAPLSTTYGAEGDLQGVVADTSVGYAVRVTDLTASGGGAYHLAHVQAGNQSLTLPITAYVTTSGPRTLTFRSRLGWASSDQVARVEASFNDGAGWTTLYEQAGTGNSGETSYQSRSIDLSPYAGRTMQVRFVYEFSSGTFFNQTDSNVGWLLDDIAFSGVQVATPVRSTSVASGSSFDFTATATGERGLQARGLFFGQYAMGWGTVLPVTATSDPVGGSGGGGGGGGSNTSRIVNLSVRASASGDALKVGVTVGGSGNKPLLLRVIGPTLADFGVEGVASDPALNVFNNGAVIASNDNWSTSLNASFNQVGAFPLTVGAKDAALVATLPSGNYPSGVDTQGHNGVVLVEAYDMEKPGVGTARLVNVSALNFVGTGSDVLVAGFVIDGTGPKTVLIRGVGASLGLAPFGIPGVLANPQLEVHELKTGEPNVLRGSNNDWNNNATLAATMKTIGAFDLSSNLDSALLLTLEPGRYSATVSGVNETTGIAIVEVYEVE